MKKNQWACYIGNVLIAMNEIDGMTFTCKSKVVGDDITKKWRELPLAKRLKCLCKDKNLNDTDPVINNLHGLLKQALELCALRNKIAHGMFAIDCDRPMEQDLESQIVMFSDGPNFESITAEELISGAAHCNKLSGDISKQLAIIEMYKMQKINKHNL